ncbi:DNA-binding transcriptional ArsR family regulator [Rubricella aquisinus]|uniref:DNA-binding transcriptional ArsR family regulator n=1 Tax=Rubricella aquisinus TaxID=2028108 RepID=A0A840WWJ4_9RHOB|nr:winged helix-turn-helix domain-containing protein [Rubricella aquisinus]MBB5515550.1 DNA-binding transcriptional ArsR family regulator [Rubricella aquisinus]
MKDGPDIARIAALIGDPARAAMLTALMDGAALTPTELAAEAGVTKQTASAHIAKLEAAGLTAREVQGRHHYLRLADGDVATVLEALMTVAERRGGRRTRPGPADPALRYARVCYDHLAGAQGVALYDHMQRKGWIADGPVLTDTGARAFEDLGVDIAALRAKRRPVCRACLDWSVRRHHLGGGLGQAVLTRFEEMGWVRRAAASRVITFTPTGKTAFAAFLR